MSLIRCEQHDRPFDSDFIEHCPQCEDDLFCEGCFEIGRAVELMPNGKWFCGGCQVLQKELEEIWRFISTKM